MHHSNLSSLLPVIEIHSEKDTQLKMRIQEKGSLYPDARNDI
jgi:hypothetical protein